MPALDASLDRAALADGDKNDVTLVPDASDATLPDDAMTDVSADAPTRYPTREPTRGPMPEPMLRSTPVPMRPATAQSSIRAGSTRPPT